MDFLKKDIEEYARLFSSMEKPLLTELDRETHIKVLYPRMLSGKMQGLLLSFLSQMIKPQRILEIGTFTAYSTICLASGLQVEGEIDTIEINEELEDIITKYLKKANIEKQTNVYFGKALEIIPKLNKKYDLAFIDADKINNINYYKLLFDKVKKGGFILIDNVLWSGKVTEQQAHDKDTIAIREFNKYVQEDRRVENMLLPFRDGIMMVRKI